MILIESTFNNFRCFKQYKIQYGKETTVIIGKNGTGKSSVLSGIRRGLSFMFARPKNFPKNFSTSNNSIVKSYEKLEANFDSVSRSYNYPINNSFKAVYDNKEFDWALVKNNMNSGLSTIPYSDFLNYILEKYNSNDSTMLPILAVFADSFPHIHLKSEVIVEAKKIIHQDIVPRDFGYYSWDDRTSCIELWLSRFYKVSNYEKDLRNDIERIDEHISFLEKLIDSKDGFGWDKVPEWKDEVEKLKDNRKYLNNDNRIHLFSKERKFIENKLIEFTKPLDAEYNFINREFELYRLSIIRQYDNEYTLEFSFKDSRSITFETLPMGYKRIFSIVLDIAYRSFILNDGVESEGIVLIDEIELHLHPTLQQEVLERLRKTFPKIQFIVTTHSPLVISNFKSDLNNKIISLEHDGNDYSNKSIENIYGIDYNTGLTEIMGANYRKSSIDKLIDSIVILKKYKNEEQAEKIREKLLELVGDNKFIDEEIEMRVKQNNQ